MNYFRFFVVKCCFGLLLVALLAAPGCSWLLLAALLAAPGCSWLLLAAPVLGPWRDPKNQVSGGCLRALGKWSDLGCFRLLFGPLA